MNSKVKKIIFVAVGLGAIGAGIYLLRKKKAKALLPGAITTGGDGSSSIAADSGSPAAPATWKKGDPSNPNDTGDAVNMYHVWGYAKTFASGGKDPFKNPHVRVFLPDGKTPYGPEYIGDAQGVYNLWIPSDDYWVSITAPGYRDYMNQAHVISNGYKLWMNVI